MIRKATEEDLLPILNIFNHAIQYTTAIYDYHLHTLEEQNKWYRDKLQGGYPVIVYEEYNEVIGFATYGRFRPQPAYKYTIEHSIYVHPQFQNKGIGKSLLNEIINLAEQLGYASMIGVIDASNIKSIGLHERFNFKQVGIVKKAGYKFKRWLDVVLLQLELKGPEHPVEN
ncbi:MAG: GNAT family N-acetyltransferase [Eubacteriales bacterium]